jgi:hypothetical protein
MMPGFAEIAVAGRSGPGALLGKRHDRPTIAPTPADAPSRRARRVNPVLRCSMPLGVTGVAERISPAS